jgi:RimJ/RimL family protein N-acetyltransferase
VSLDVGAPFGQDHLLRMPDLPPPIRSRRLSLVALTVELLDLMSGDVVGHAPFDWPEWWPDETDRRHVRVWQGRAAAAHRNIEWGPRAVIDAHDHMIGHAGFHLPPRPLAVALDDPTFVGRREPDLDDAVEIGYTIFPSNRGRGYATEAVAALVAWAAASREVRALLATVARGNEASFHVLERVGGFVEIGTCRSDAGEVEVVFRRDL